MRSIKNIVLTLSLVALWLFSAEVCFAQKYPERRAARQGNEQYESGDFSAAEIQYRKAIEQNSALYEANFNLGDALYRQQRHSDAAKLFGSIAADSLRTSDQKAEALFNMGNSYFGERKFEEAIEAYKSSLRLKPDDVECKFNLAYAQKMLEHQQQQQQQDQQNQEQNKEQQDQNQEQNKDQQENQDQQDKQDKQDDRDQQNKNQQGDGKQEPEPQSNQPKQEPQNSPKGNAPQPRMSQQEAEQLLQAVQGEEDKTRDKMDRQRGVAVGRSGKNW